MATNLDDLTAIRTRFLGLWNAAVPLVLDNEPAIDEPSTTWARFSVQPIQERRPSIGATKRYEMIGAVWLQVYVPRGTADFDAYTLAEIMNAAFRDWNSADFRIRFKTPEFTRDGSEPDFYSITVRVPYTAQH